MSEGRFIAVALGAYALLAIVGGLLWRLWWTAPNGMVISQQWIPGAVQLNGSLYPLADPPQDIPAATAHWAILAIAVGLIGGLIVVLGARGREYAALAVGLVGSACAGLLMCGVGYLNRGGDPRAVAAILPDGAMLHDRIQLAEPWLLALPLVASGTVIAIAFLGWAARPAHHVAQDVTHHIGEPV
ncbi:hypothetical protein [Nocardioides baekrokdamisoli]|uniref:hypothetical protein n=1 Tax=Nocardioides baekrokdamisoli TaxID=1804624 RepID=UPI000F79D6D2|nr:hypothetical protein [Nocardioides baekrokdamisoli]